MGCDWCERPVGASHAVTCPLKGYVTEPAAPSAGGVGDEIATLRSEIARLRESLAIFVHAHATGNIVQPHLEAAAKELVKEAGSE